MAISITWDLPIGKNRFQRDIRGQAFFLKLLGTTNYVIEEAGTDAKPCWMTRWSRTRTGRRDLSLPCISQANGLVVLMLGTNDLKQVIRPVFRYRPQHWSSCL
jgi:lysophospholipase L1-like esterase